MMCVKAITVRFHLSHPAEKQAWEKLNARRSERHQSFSQLVAEAVNACGTEGVHLSGTEKIELVQEITESVTSRLQQMLPAYLAGYSAGANTPVAIAVPQTNTAPSQVGLVDKSSLCRRDCLHSNIKETPAGVIQYT